MGAIEQGLILGIKNKLLDSLRVSPLSDYTPFFEKSTSSQSGDDVWVTLFSITGEGYVNMFDTMYNNVNNYAKFMIEVDGQDYVGQENLGGRETFDFITELATFTRASDADVNGAVQLTYSNIYINPLIVTSPPLLVDSSESFIWTRPIEFKTSFKIKVYAVQVGEAQYAVSGGVL